MVYAAHTRMADLRSTLALHVAVAAVFVALFFHRRKALAEKAPADGQKPAPAHDHTSTAQDHSIIAPAAPAQDHSDAAPAAPAAPAQEHSDAAPAAPAQAALEADVPPEAVLVATLPLSFESAEYACLDVSAQTVPLWPAENVCVWHRKRAGEPVEACALQEACPHAGISLLESDIEDFRLTGLGQGLRGPCVSCPAHTYVFDAGSGRCLTNPGTRAARTYDTWATEAEDGIRLYLRPTPNGADDLGAGPPIRREAANAIQLALVEKGMRLRYGDDDEEEAALGTASLDARDSPLTVEGVD